MRFQCLFILLLSAAAAGIARPLVPVEAQVSLLAGNGQAGSIDGDFLAATFKAPVGIVYDAGAQRLIVADVEDHRLRTIDLSQGAPVVGTLAGATAGYVDGPFQGARFNGPDFLALGTAGRVLVVDQGQKVLRVLSLSVGTVGTVYRSAGKILAAQEPSPGSYWLLEQGNRLSYLSGASPTARAVIPPQGLGLLRSLLVDNGAVYVFSDSGMIYASSEAALLTATASPASWTEFLQTKVTDGVLVPAAEEFTASFALLLDRQSCRIYRVSQGRPLFEIESTDDTGRSAPLQDAQKRVAADLTAACYDHPFRRIFATNRLSRRVLKIRDGLNGLNKEGDNPFGINDWIYPKAAPPGVQRLGIVGSSFDFAYDERGKDLAKRMEHWLNVLSGLVACPGHYEVQLFGQKAFHISMVQRTRDIAPLLHSMNVDEIVLSYNYYALVDHGIGWITHGGNTAMPDPEWATLNAQQKIARLPAPAAKLYARLYETRKENKEFYRFTADDNIDFATESHPYEWEMPILKDLQVREALLAMQEPALDEMKKAVEKEWAGAKVPGITILYLPIRNIMGMSETDEAGRDGGKDLMEDFFGPHIKAIAEKLGIGFISAQDDATVLEPVFNPLFIPGNNHPTAHGHELFALTASVRLLQRSGCIGPAVPAAK